MSSRVKGGPVLLRDGATESTERTIPIGEAVRARLASLYAQQQQATLLYQTALSTLLDAHGLPDSPNVTVNLDLGAITVGADGVASPPTDGA